ncbi:MAG: hypothetical protein IPM35_23315 [Myxococcales bacterium]|nr:hypothetical protein [Myxococcales bacterium]
MVGLGLCGSCRALCLALACAISSGCGATPRPAKEATAPEPPTPTPTPKPTSTPSCTPTVPPKPGLRVPGDRPQEHPAGVWYGTPELWTVLPATGEYRPRKSVWWSVRFGGGQVEQRPDVRVVARRLDAEQAPIISAGPGTNAHTETDGWFMIANFPTHLPSGCWEITATYKGEWLRYVVEAP